MEPVVAADDPLGSRLRHLLELGDGWHDGDGLAPKLGAVEWVRDFAADLTPQPEGEVTVTVTDRPSDARVDPDTGEVILEDGGSPDDRGDQIDPSEESRGGE